MVTKLIILLTLVSGACLAQTATPMQPASAQNPAVQPGHSMYGPAFDEGPRQHAYIMKGLPAIDFPVTTKSKLAQKFFNQGVSQLHGFWWLESERSFRQAAAIDPSCAMAYWGMAYSSAYNETRAKAFIAKAKEKIGSVTPRERLWIEAEDEYLNTDSAIKDRDKTRARKYAARLADLMRQYPNDIEAKAFYCVFCWNNSAQMDGYKQEPLDAILKQVLAKNPMHPAHHYRIHLWNYVNDKNAIDSAARCGQSFPACAHMWHMSGHTFSRVNRYADAAWQQEASARVDHAYMIRDHVLPDEIHNYAHNNQWCVEDLEFIGRVRDAIELAKNLIDLPRHPKFNSLEQRTGSASQGRSRLLETLTQYELWDELIALSKTDYLPETTNRDLEIPRLRAIGVALASTGREPAGSVRALEAIVEKDKDKKSTVDQAIAEIRCCRAISVGDRDEASKQLANCSDLRRSRQARLQMRIGKLAEAEENASQAVKNGVGQVEPLATYTEVLFAEGKKKEAGEQLKALQAISGEVDMQAPIFHRISAISRELGGSDDWRVIGPFPEDSGVRPPLDKLGPFRWQPPAAPRWEVTDSDGNAHSLADYMHRGKPVLLCFYLGTRCAQCMEQLNAFVPAVKDFEKAGIQVIAVSTDSDEGLHKTFATGEQKFPFPLVSDESLALFKKYRAYDDFEKTPLHGLFLIDPKGKVRWQDISYQPFKDTAFLLAESKRLLAQTAEASRLAKKYSAPAIASLPEIPVQAVVIPVGNGPPDRIFLNKGTHDGVRTGTEFVLRRGDEYVGRLLAAEVFPDDTEAKILTTARGIKPEDKAISIPNSTRVRELANSSGPSKGTSQAGSNDRRAPIVAVLVGQFSGGGPPPEGYILNKGYEDGVRPGMRFDVRRGGNFIAEISAREVFQTDTFFKILKLAAGNKLMGEDDAIYVPDSYWEPRLRARRK